MGGDQALASFKATHGLRSMLVAIVLAATLGPTVLAAEPEVLTTARELHRLTPQQSGAGLPVKLRGVVTYVRGVGPGITLQDATGGLCADCPEIPGTAALRPGMELEIEGITATNPPTPRVRVQRMKILGNPGLPSPLVRTLAELLTGDLEASLVEFTGQLRSVQVVESVEPHRLALGFGPLHARVSVWVSRWNGETLATYRPGAMVRVRGVLLRWKTTDWLPYSTFAVAHDPSWVSVVAQPASIDGLPFSTVPEVLNNRPDDDVPAMLRVRGVVTLNRSPQGLVIQDDDAALWIRPRRAVDFQPGEQVEAMGFPGRSGDRNELEDAEVRSISRAALPEPVEISAAQLSHNSPQWKDGHYARVRGTVRRSSVSDAGITQWLDFDKHTLSLRLPPGNDPPTVAGTRVEATGVLEAHLNPHIRQTGWGLSDYELHLQGPASLKVIAPAPWWTQQRLFAALGIILLLAGGSALWALSLRQRVVEKSAQLAQEITARHDQELLAEERQRLARDLHDTIEQTLTGAALQLDAVEATYPEPDAVVTSEPLQLARRLLDRSRDELRRAVWDLTPGLLEQSGLPAALHAMASEQSRGGGVSIEIHCDPAAENLPDRLAAHLCRVVQEASSNAIRHGRAGNVSVTLRLEAKGVILIIADDGTGFDPATAPGITTGHFGLNGMTERLRRLGGDCEIISRPGEGTTILARCPTQTVTLYE